MLYGVEVWGWRNNDRVDKIKRKYEKWILDLDVRTPNYILTEETKMKELRLKAVKRAIKYEEKSIKEVTGDRMYGRNREGKKRQRRE